jgi:hypothetical protein
MDSRHVGNTSTRAEKGIYLCSRLEVLSGCLHLLESVANKCLADAASDIGQVALDCRNDRFLWLLSELALDCS